MGKIYKALEKSKKEQKGKPGKTFRAFGPTVKTEIPSPETGQNSQAAS